MAKTKAKDLDKLLKDDRLKRAQKSGKGAIGKGAAVPAIPTGPRAGVQKRKSAPQPPSSLNGKWTHDLHNSVADVHQYKSLGATGGAKAPIIINQKMAQKMSSNRLFEALHAVGGAAGNTTASDLGINIRGASKPNNVGISIKGSAGPFAVHGSNFASGTTASDIRTFLGGYDLPVLNCGILSANPTVIAEILFEKRDAADRCVELFNNRLADGRLLHFMLKDTPQLPVPTKTRNQLQTQAQPVAKSIPTGPARQQRGPAHVVVDGKYGFSAPRNAGSGLYSDAMVAGGSSKPAGNRGRGAGKR
ncbi:hypothetical protein TWF281_011845 [Arthrobotrys megalospora]